MRRSQTADAEGVASLVSRSTACAIDLYHALATTPGNLCFSPYSVSVASGMAYAGARGETARQMEVVLHLREGTDDHRAFGAIEAMLAEISERGAAKLYSANSLWPQRRHRFLRTYRKLLAESYGIEEHAVDYRGNPEEARADINRWVLDHTVGRIADIIPQPLSPLTTLILVNALYLKAQWEHQFPRYATDREPFHTADGRQVRVDMMRQAQTFPYTEADGLQALELAYSEQDLVMLVFLPRKADGLAQLESRLTTELLGQVTDQFVSTRVEVFLPRFRVRTRLRLSETMRRLGMVDAFAQDRADFSGMDGTRDFAIAEAFHGAFVEVNEEGTEASAATAFRAILGRVVPPPPMSPVFRADHPFIYLIRQRSTGTILFMGRVEAPK